MDQKSKNFRLIVERLKRTLLLKTDKDIAEKLGLNPKAFHARKQSGSIPYPEIIDLANHYSLNLHWVLTGEEKSVNDTNIVSDTKTKFDAGASNLTKIVIEHQDMVKRFKNPEKAKEFNEFLVEIETEDPEGYEELFKEAKAISKTIKRLKNKHDLKKTPKSAKNGTEDGNA